MKKLVGLFVFIFVCLGVSTFFVSTAIAVRGVTDDTIRIGVISDRTGPCADTILPIMSGSETYFKWVNLKGFRKDRKPLDIRRLAKKTKLSFYFRYPLEYSIVFSSQK